MAAGGHLSVSEAARSLGISEATIRRDLDQLAEQRMLTRTRGGAVGSSQMAYDLPLLYKSARNAPEKHPVKRPGVAGDRARLDAARRAARGVLHSRHRFRGRGAFLLLVLATQMLQPTALIVGIY